MSDRIDPPPGSRIVLDPAELSAHYGWRHAERAAHIYALVDLEEPFWSASTWYRRGDAVVGLVGLPDSESVTVYAVTTRDVEGCLDLVGDLAPELAAGVLVTGPVGLAERLASVRPLSWSGPHLRYELADRRACLAAAEAAGVARLGVGDLDRLAALYDSDPGAAFFLPHMLADDSFVGVVDPTDSSRLLAAAGTHVLSVDQGVAAIGSVYARPEARGQGLGRRVTAGVVAAIADRIDTIGLNVAADNTAARRIYETLGFRPVLDYEEAGV